MIVNKAITFRASALGDALNAKYLFDNVHAAYPEARCAIIVSSKASMIRDLLRAHPWIDVVQANHRDLKSLGALWRTYRDSDLVVIPRTKAGSAFSFLSKIAARLLARRGALIGFVDASRLSLRLYDQVLPRRDTEAPRVSERDVLRAAGIPIAVESVVLEHVPQERLLPRLGLVSKNYIVVHLFAGAGSRGPSQEKRQELIDTLFRYLPQTPMVLTGTAVDGGAIASLVLPGTVRVVAGSLSVQELMALMVESACVLSVGSGPSHIASSLGVPTVVLVTCHGVPWVGKEQYGEAALIQVHCNASACINGHDYGRAYPACIETVNTDALAQAVTQYSKQRTL